MVKLYNNQLGVNIHSPKNVEDPFFKENVNVCFDAMRDLGGNAYMLWQYLASNRDGYSFALSFADVSNVTGLGRSAYTSAKDLLISKGYLVPVEGSAWYDFYRTPNLVLIASRRSSPDSVQKIFDRTVTCADSQEKIEQSCADSQEKFSSLSKSCADSVDKIFDRMVTSPDSHDKISSISKTSPDSQEKIYNKNEEILDPKKSSPDSVFNLVLIANKTSPDSHERNTIIHINTINNIDDFKKYEFVHKDDPSVVATGEQLLRACDGSPENLAQVYECYPDTKQFSEYFGGVDWNDYKW